MSFIKIIMTLVGVFFVAKFVSIFLIIKLAFVVITLAIISRIAKTVISFFCLD